MTSVRPTRHDKSNRTSLYKTQSDSAIQIGDADIALLQEVPKPADLCVPEVLPKDPLDWVTAGWPTRNWRTAVARLSDRVRLDHRPTSAIQDATSEADWTTARSGTLTATDVYVEDQPVFTAVSVYAPWDRTDRNELYSDAAAHRILSDLSALMQSPRHKLVVAGDWNILRGYGEHGESFWAGRYATVFDRAEALGLTFAGPEYPNGRQADPWPEELPPDSTCVPTFHHSQQTPATATRQLDFVFVSGSLANCVQARALNEPREWGPSDHCRVVIDVGV